MFEIETHEYSKANLERLAFYYEKIKKGENNRESTRK